MFMNILDVLVKKYSRMNNTTGINEEKMNTVWKEKKQDKITIELMLSRDALIFTKKGDSTNIKLSLST